MVGKIEQAWAELMKLPEDEQEVAADAILDYTSGGHGIELSAEQVAEVERRLADPNPATLTITEFRARLRNALKEVEGSYDYAVLDAPPVRIDTRTREVLVAGRRAQLAQKEYELLLQLAGEPERVFTKAELLREVWGYMVVGRTRTLDSHASRLRRKLRALEPSVSFVDNVWGVGYRLLGTIPEQ